MFPSSDQNACRFASVITCSTSHRRSRHTSRSCDLLSAAADLHPEMLNRLVRRQSSHVREWRLRYGTTHIMRVSLICSFILLRTLPSLGCFRCFTALISDIHVHRILVYVRHSRAHQLRCACASCVMPNVHRDKSEPHSRYVPTICPTFVN